MVLRDIPIGRYGYPMNGDLFRVPDNPINHLTDYREMAIVLWPGTTVAVERRYPASMPCKDAPKWNMESGDDNDERN